MAEWSIAAVLKTVDCNRSGGSNPSLSASKNHEIPTMSGFFYIQNGAPLPTHLHSQCILNAREDVSTGLWNVYEIQ
jgi:hypothetical protein